MSVYLLAVFVGEDSLDLMVKCHLMIMGIETLEKWHLYNIYYIQLQIVIRIYVIRTYKPRMILSYGA